MNSPETPMPATADLQDAALEAGFNGFFQRHQREVESFLANLETDRQLVEEVTQDAFLAARQKWARIRNYDKPMAWVIRVARNILIDKQKARSRRPMTTPYETEISDPAAPASPVEADELLKSWLRRLPHRHREVFALAFCQQWTDKEIGQILGLAYTTVRTYRAEARERLQEMAKEAGFTHPTGRRRR